MTPHPTYATARHPDTDRRGLFAIGAWIRLAGAGALACVGGIAVLVDDASIGAPALAASLGGALLATFAWRRARAALDRLDASESLRTVVQTKATRLPATQPGLATTR